MKVRWVAILSILICWSTESYSQSTTSKMTPTLKIHHLKRDFAIAELENIAWTAAQEIVVDIYWSGVKAPTERSFNARLLWSDTAIYIRFEANQHEPLIVSGKPDIKNKTDGLWNRDVCEIFIAPDKVERSKYFEFFNKFKH